MRLIFTLLFAVVAGAVSGQKIPTFTQYFTNPYIYNPAYAGLEGRNAVTLTHRRQWVGINNAPITSNLVYHTALGGGVNMGLNVTQDEAGIFQYTSGLITLGYSVGLGWNHFLSFGISGGAAFNTIDFTGVNINDPALANVLDNNTSLEGNAGIAYHIGNFNIGATLPRLFKTSVYGIETFDVGEFDALSNYIINASYSIYFGMGSHVLMPMVLYRSYQEYEPQFEAGLTAQFNDVFWIGGNYRQNFGYAGMVGFKLKGNLAIGYAYEIPANAVSGVNAATHEVQLTISFGNKRDRAKKYSTFLASAMVEKPRKEIKEEVVEPEPDPEPEPEPVPVPVEEPEEEEEEVEEDPQEEETQTNESQAEPQQNQQNNPAQNQPDPTPEVSAAVATTLAVPAGAQVVNTRGYHPFELDEGYYAVISSHDKMNDAIAQADRLNQQGLQPGIGYSSATKQFYVHNYKGNNPNEAEAEKDRLVSAGFDGAAILVVDAGGLQQAVTTSSAGRTSANETGQATDTGVSDPGVSNEEGDAALVVSQGNHPFELDKGHYVIVGAFGVMENAIRTVDRLGNIGYRPGIGYSSQKKLFYVFMYEGNSPAEARTERNRLRTNERFKDAWYLVVK